MESHSGHRARMRAKYLRFGPGSMSDAELAEMALYSVFPRGDVRPLAEELVNGHGGLPGVTDLTDSELSEINGVGDAVTLFIKVLKGLTLRAESQRHMGAMIRGFDSVKRYLRAKFSGLDREAVFEVCVGNDGRVVSCVLIHDGHSDKLEDMRQFVDPAVEAGTDTVILAHNKLKFSGAEDLEVDFIRKLNDTLRSFNIKLLDYFIFYRDQCISATMSNFLPGTEERRDYKSLTYSFFPNTSKKQPKIRTLFDDEEPAGP